MAKNRENSRGKGPKNTSGLIPFKPGQSGNPKGRPFGSRDRRTVIMDAIIRIGKEKNMTPEEIEDAIQAAGIEKAFKGSFFHYEAISDGLYGRMTDKMDFTSGGKTLADLVAQANGGKKPTKRTRGAATKVQE